MQFKMLIDNIELGVINANGQRNRISINLNYAGKKFFKRLGTGSLSQAKTIANRLIKSWDFKYTVSTDIYSNVSLVLV